jgi:hypothetical protein
LETIDHNTPIKDADYWQYYEAIELFLYGDWQQAENGEIWGIKNFHSVWESMCLTHLVQLTNPSLLVYLDPQYLDSRILEKVESSTKVINLSDALQINGVQLKPDAIVVRTLDIQIKGEKTYTVSPNTWNDFGYHTFLNGIEEKKFTRVACIGQSHEHTFGKLQELYQQYPFGRLVINARLPNIFYSFWEIPEQLNSDYLHKMCYFNHFFYLALEKQIMDWDSFYEEIFKPLGIFLGRDYSNSELNVFTRSLLRDYLLNG